MEEIYTAEFLVHDVQCNVPYIAKPAITLRFLEFPTLTVFGTVQKTIIFNKGKSCKFSMTLTVLRESLKRYPLYVMLVDAFPNNIKMLGSAAVDLSGFAEAGIPSSSDFRRNLINLHDPVKNIIARLDISISISLYTDGIVRTPAEVFEKIKYDNLKVTPPDQQSDKSIGTDPLPVQIPGKVMKTSETMTVVESNNKEIQTSVFQDLFSPPPMFFTKAKTQAAPVYYPTIPPPCPVPPMQEYSPELLIDKLIQEIQHLKQVSSLQQNWAYPPPMSLKNPPGKNQETAKFFDSKASEKSVSSNSNLKDSSKASEKASENSGKSSKRTGKYSEKSSERLHYKTIKEKESVYEYSEDFEEESIVKSSSRDGFTKCFLCGEHVRNSEAREHPAQCKKIRDKYQSPRPGSSGTWGKDLIKSVTSIAEEYESDFEKASSNLSSNRS